MSNIVRINEINFNSYLAGLIEGDGFLMCPSEYNKVWKPKIGIAGHKKDKFFFEWLSRELGYGEIKKWSSPNSLVFFITEEKDIKDFCNRIKYFFRTGKVERMNSLLSYYGLEPVKIDTSDILDNGWLAGMSDADSNFNVIIGNRKKAGKVQKVQRINCQWRLELSTTTSNNKSNLDVCSVLSRSLNTEVMIRTRKAMLEKSKKLEYHSIMVLCHNEKQQAILIDYFTKYPLLTAKRNDFENWKSIKFLNDKKLNTNSTEEKIKLVEAALKLKNRMNNNNINVNWHHLCRGGPDASPHRRSAPTGAGQRDTR